MASVRRFARSKKAGKATSSIVLLFVATLLAGTISPAGSPFRDPERVLAEALAQARGQAPKQEWGSAEGNPHEAGPLPEGQRAARSERSRYPQPDFPEPVPRANNATVGTATTEVTGYDPERSTERDELRGEYKRTYDNPDGTQTSEYSSRPLNYRAPDGSWQPIDPALVRAGTGWSNTADQVDVGIAGSAGARRLATVRLPSGQEIAYGVRGARDVAGRADGSTVTYPGIADGVDLTLRSQPGGVKEVLVLRTPEAQRRWVFPLHLSGLTARTVDGRVALHDGAGAEVAQIPPGHMTDAAGQTSVGVAYRLIEGGRALEVTLDQAWLDAPERAYPVSVDPTVNGYPSRQSMFVHGSTPVSGTGELWIGAIGGGDATAYIGFPNLENDLRNHRIFSAKLQLVNYDSVSCRPAMVHVHPVKESWTSATRPALDAALAGSAFAHGYIRLGQTHSACPAAPVGIDLGVPGQQLVQAWVKHQRPNHGLALRAPTGAWKKFTASGTANPPTLFLTHTPYDARYKIVNPVPEPPVTTAQSGRVKISVTNLGKDPWPVGAYTLGYRAYRDGALKVTKTAAGALPQEVSVGETVTVDATIAAFSETGRYTLDFSMVHGQRFFTDEQIAPARIVVDVYDLPPAIAEQYPRSGQSVETLTPQLWAKGVDHENDTLRYRFEVCEKDGAGNPYNCFGSSTPEQKYLSKPYWTVPAGKLRWGPVYSWRSFAFDGTSESKAVEFSALLTSVPQPQITSRLGAAPYTGGDFEFDPLLGNYSTAAIDAAVATAGPRLAVARTYNSLDPRRDLAFGSGWTTQYDARISPDADGSGNLIVTYPDGQQVRFGRNPDGSYTAPPGRFATLTARPPAQNDGWTLTDKDRTVYTFLFDGKLASIKDSAGRVVDLVYNIHGHLSQAISRTSGRSLWFTWTTAPDWPRAHVTEVRTDPVDGVPLAWTYGYSGDQLQRVCDPDQKCTHYRYAAGSHYRSAVMDSRPESYWRLNETAGLPHAASQVAAKAGKDNADYVNVNNGYVPDALEGADDTAVQLPGNGHIDLPDRSLYLHRDVSVELWFKTTSAGPLVGYQNKPITETATSGVPLLYVGSDGKLRGQFWTGTANPITTAAAVNDGQWHHVVLSGSLATQALYLDGVKVGTREGVIDHNAFVHAQIGAAYTTAPASWPGYPGSTPGRHHIAAEIDEAAYYARPLGDLAVAAHYAARTAADQLTEVELPDQRFAARVAYDPVNDRMREYTDANGGRWQLATPTVGGTEDNLVRTVGVIDPSGRPHFYDYDALNGRVLRQSVPVGTGVRPEDVLDGDCVTGPDGVIRCQDIVLALGVRLFDYDENGFPSRIEDELGHRVTLDHDERGNLTAKTTCRTPGDCQTTRYTYQPPTSDPTDPRTDRLIEVRDPRSSGPDDDRYLTSSTYTEFGDLAVEVNPDGGDTTHAYTDGTSAAVGGGVEPARLLSGTKDPRGAVTRYRYYANGDLAEMTTPAGLRTAYQYDALGRLIAETEYPDGHPDGVTTRYGYDKVGRITEITEPGTTNAVTGTVHIRRTVTAYDANGNPVRIEEHDSAAPDATRVITHEYDAFNRLVRTVGPAGDELAYGYDHFGNMVWAVDALGVKTEYRYTARHKLAEVRLKGWHGAPITPGDETVEGDGSAGSDLVLESYTYDYAGKLLRQVDAMGRKTEFTYFGDGLTARIIAADVADPVTGGTRDVVLQDNTYDAAGNLVRQVGAGGSVVVHEHDATGRLTATTLDPDGLRRRTAYRYDLGGNVIEVARTGAHSNTGPFAAAFGEIVEFGYDIHGRQVSETIRGSAGVSKTTMAYNNRDQVIRTVSPLGNATGADPAAHTTDYRYDEIGRPVGVTAPPVDAEQDGGPAQRVRPEQVTGYNAFGEATEQRNALGEVVRMTYDQRGHVVRTESPGYLPPGASTPSTAVTTVRYDPFGRPLSTTDPAGAVSGFRYDQRGRLVERYEPDPVDPTEPGGLWRYEYTHSDELLAVVDPSGARVESTYDDFGRQITTTVLERKPAPAALTARMSYDDAGRLLTSTTPTGAVTRFTYDALGQRIKATDPAGVVTEYGYDGFGNQVWSKDGKGRARYASLDQSGNVLRESDYNPAGTRIARRSYSYDLEGNVLTETDAMGRVTRFAYDPSGRLVSRVEPVSADEAITTTFGYDALGRQTRVTDGRGNSTHYTYNTLGLPESVIEPATDAHPAPADRTWTATYDAAGRATLLTAPGGVTRSRVYDGLGRLTRETGAGAEAATLDRVLTYDQVGRVTTLSAPGGTNLYEYNDRGMLLSASGPSGNASFGYDDDGRMISRTDAAGTMGFGYRDGRLVSIQDGVSGASMSVAYTAAGEVDTIDYGGGVARKFTYDDFGRTTADVTRDAANAVVASVSYSYDLNHRLTGKATTGTADPGEQTYGYDQLGRLTSWTADGVTKSYGWDAAGNRVRNGDKTAAYDQRNRLLSDGDYTYQYTARGTTAARTSSGHEERFDFDAFDRLIKVGATELAHDGLDRPVTRGTVAFKYAGMEIDTVSDGTAVYGRGAGGELLSLSQGTEKRLLLSDRHGDVIGGFAPGAGTLSDSTSYDPFGDPRTTTGAARNVGYQGDWTDPDTGRVNMGARWYDPAAGRFMSRDSIAQGGPGSAGLNRYGYSGGSPLNGFDANGHWWDWIEETADWVGDNLSTVGHAALDVAGMIPVIGEAADVANGIWYAAEGNYTDAALSFAGAIPFAGWAGTGTKWGRRVDDIGSGGRHTPVPSKWQPTKRYDKEIPGGRKVGKGKGDVPSGAKAAPNPRKAADAAAAAAARRAAAARAAYLAAVARTAKAKAAVAYAVKRNPMPVLKSMLKPTMANPKNLVSAVANAPARYVQQAVSNVQDVNRVYDKIYDTMLGVGHEVVKEAAETAAAEVMAGSGIPMLDGVVDLLDRRKKGPSEQGKTARGTATNGSCSASSKAQLNSNSFTGDTPVLLADGTRKPIKDMRVGDVVLATDPTTGESGPRVVTDVRSHQSERLLYEITVDTADGSGKITATDEHPFWVESLQKWVHAEGLKPGYTFETADHRPATVAGVKPLSERREVYNLTVDDLHTYYVVAGSAVVLVHNDDPRKYSDDECDRSGFLYRGLPADHWKAADALEGRAVPLGGHRDLKSHAGGNTRSEFTSWSHDYENVAYDAATERGGEYLVLRLPFSAFPPDTLFRVHDTEYESYPGEQEHAFLGTIDGAEVSVNGRPWRRPGRNKK
ncbi:polymorphic toxin-type HINT domain-containing protein [Actinokineospora fastidiosa]|uniref:Hint domain-containing protein n=1 Tax=Actinokineospora fastidiosa TaxID=1816 RepID=A0A918G7Q7_9PSEU|nr:polymorphic toxin-type HINT domain-containing protein [Actinokineospora fastidiosa]GGS22538.1 hypothetical protein GCM10010171_14220 [Actinokineospora fastidiosa]